MALVDEGLCSDRSIIIPAIFSLDPYVVLDVNKSTYGVVSEHLYVSTIVIVM